MKKQNKPITYKLRDLWFASPYYVLWVFVFIAMLAGHWIPSEYFWYVFVSAVVFLGAGHVYWPSGYWPVRRK